MPGDVHLDNSLAFPSAFRCCSYNIKEALLLPQIKSIAAIVNSSTPLENGCILAVGVESWARQAQMPLL